MLGGIATVIWTDVMLFLVFVIGGLVALGVVVHDLPGGWHQLVTDAGEAGKFQLWNIHFSRPENSDFVSFWGEVFAEPFTIWAAIFAVTFGNIGAYGTDQLLAQHIFCCKSPGHAKLAVMTSWLAEAVAALMLLVGAGLWVYYQQFPGRLTGEAGAVLAGNKDTLLPVFSLLEVPTGLTGLIIAGVFAAAISSLTSILAALSQTTISAVYLPLRGLDVDSPELAKHNREVLRVSRALVVFWGIALCAMAILIDRYVESMHAAGKEVPFLDLALGLASYVIGALFATFLLAWLPLKKNAYGLIWSAPLSVFTIFAARFHGDWATNLCYGVSLTLLLSWLICGIMAPDSDKRVRRLVNTMWLVVGCGLMLAVTRYMQFEKVDGTMVSISWPWYAPIGGFMAFVFAYVLGEYREPLPDPVLNDDSGPQPALAAEATAEGQA